MGEAKLKLAKANKEVLFSFDALKFLGPTDLMQKRTLAGTLIVALIKAKFPQGMGRTDGKVWAAWQEVLMDEADDTPTVVLSQVHWLLQIAETNDLKIDHAFANHREVLIDYLQGLDKDEEEAA